MSSPASASPLLPRGIAMARITASTSAAIPMTIGKNFGPTGSTLAKPSSHSVSAL